MILSFFCFVRHALVPSDIARVFLPLDLGFTPELVRSAASAGQEAPYTPGALAKLKDVHDGSVEVKGNEGSLGLASVSTLAADLVILRSEGLPSMELVDAAAEIPGFASALSGDADDVFWQSMPSVKTYKMAGRPWEHLPTVKHPIRDERRVDVSQNAGRHSRGPGMWMWAAARMRFGAGAFVVLDRQRLLACPVGVVVELADGTVTVDLYDLDDEESVHRERQRDFRDWMGYDDLEDRSRELIPPAEPAMTFDRSSKEYPGGVLITEWLRDGVLVYPDGATQQRRTQYDSGRTLQWQEVTDLTTATSQDQQ